ncbi:MAG: sensor histidine kinase, partial [Asticcacaulis sp.]
MRLAEFIRSNMPAIIVDWQDFAESLAPSAGMTKRQLKDHIEQIMAFIADDIESNQSHPEQLAKSRGLGARDTITDTAAETHGSRRHDDGFDIVEMVSEYRALRASIIKLWTAVKRDLTDDDLLDLTRFNEAIDQALAESVVRFSHRVDAAKDLLLGVLGHDIRSPLGTIHMSAALMTRLGPLNERQATLVEQIEASTVRVRHIVTDLLDLARARLGTGLPVHPAPMSLSSLAERMVAEASVQNPERPIALECSGELEGNWDELRLGQVLSNLIANAIQYGKAGTGITVTLTGEVETVTTAVHNEGPPIPRSQLNTIFNSFTRGRTETASPDAAGTSNLGLGLFIADEIVKGHYG